MKINEITVLVTKMELKKNAKGEAYLTIDFLDLESGDNFNVISKDIELMSKLKMMCKYVMNLSLSSSKYGLKLNIEDVVHDLGTI